MILRIDFWVIGVVFLWIVFLFGIESENHVLGACNVDLTKRM